MTFFQHHPAGWPANFSTIWQIFIFTVHIDNRRGNPRHESKWRLTQLFLIIPNVIIEPCQIVFGVLYDNC